MRFKGDPNDKKYRAKVLSQNGKGISAFGSALKRRIGFFLDKDITLMEKQIEAEEEVLAGHVENNK